MQIGDRATKLKLIACLSFIYLSAILLCCQHASGQTNKISPEIWPRYSSGLRHLDKGDFDDAISDFNAVIEFDRANAQQVPATLYTNRGDAYLGKGDWQKAIADYTTAITTNPNDVLSYIARGQAYSDRHEFDLAFADLDKAVSLAPSSAIAYSARANAYEKQENYTRAIADLSEVIRLEPREVNYVQRGVDYSKSGAYDNADADFEAAIRLAPSDYYPVYERGNSYARKGDYRRAIADYNTALTLKSPSDQDATWKSDVMEARGWVEYLAEAYPKAEIDERKAISIDDKNGRAHLNLALVYAVEGKTADSSEECKKGLAVAMSDELFLALKHFEIASKLHPSIAVLKQEAAELKSGNEGQSK